MGKSNLGNVAIFHFIFSHWRQKCAWYLRSDIFSYSDLSLTPIEYIDWRDIFNAWVTQLVLDGKLVQYPRIEFCEVATCLKIALSLFSPTHRLLVEVATMPLSSRGTSPSLEAQFLYWDLFQFWELHMTIHRQDRSMREREIGKYVSEKKCV